MGAEVVEQMQDDEDIAKLEAQAAAAMEEDDEEVAVEEEAALPGDDVVAEASKAEGPKTEVEVELDDPQADPKAKRVTLPVALNSCDSTPDVFFSDQTGCMVSSLSQGGFRHLLSGVRCNTGASGGRYLFEVKVLERIPGAKTVLSIGFSLAKSSLFLGDGSTTQVFFDSEGTYHAPKPGSAGAVKNACKKLGQHVIGVLLNVDKGSNCENTVSIFLNGVRAGKPQPIPAHLKGKVLYPTIAFQNVTLAVNFGREQRRMKALPFTCTMFAQMLESHSERASFDRPKDGKFQVVVPIGLPEEGFFDFVDRFLDSHPGFEELSDRRLMEWCRKSGLTKEELPSATNSVDRPDFTFGLKDIDDRSVRPMLEMLAQLTNRDYIVADLTSNLLAKERQHLLSLFPPGAQTSALVAFGEPSASFKQWVHEKIRSTYLEKKAEVEKMKAIVEAAGEDFAATVPKSQLEMPSEPVINDSVWFLPQLKNEGVPDVSAKDLSLTYDKFSLPVDTEGFSKVGYEWLSKDAAAEHLKKWILKRKATTVVEGLEPGTWFTERQATWIKLRSTLRKNAQEYQAKKSKGGADDSDIGMFDIKNIKLENIHDVDTKGTPLYASFKYEDWVLLSWRLELHFLTHAFLKDTNDPDRPGVPEEHLKHYSKVYFKRETDVADQMNVASLEKALKLMRGPVELIDKGGGLKVLQSKLDADTPIEDFIKGIETYRRDRQRRIDAGDESAQLKFKKPEPAKAKPAKSAPAKAAAPAKANGTPAKVASTPKAAAAGAVKRPVPPTAADSDEPVLKKSRPDVPDAPDETAAPPRKVVETSAGKVVVTKAPLAKTPVTKAPVAKVAVAKTPVTKSPSPGPAVTKAPITKAPITKAPITKAPVTKAPITKAPVTKAPITKAPIAKRPPVA